jgi:hypothetical protein
VWAAAVAVVSAALILIGVTGLYMWFTRRPERRIGLVLLTINVLFAVILMFTIRQYGP